MRRELKKELADCFKAPGPARREEFLSRLRMPREPAYRFVMTQLSYVGKKGVAAAFLALASVVGVGKWQMHFSGDALLWMIAAVLPLFAVAVVAESGRSSRCRMAELECCCRYHLPEIMLVRTGFLCGVNLVVLFGTFLMLRGSVSYGALALGIYLFMPYLLTCVLILAIQSLNRGEEKRWYYTAAGIFVGALSFCLPGAAGELYSERYFGMWVSVFIALCYILIRQILKIKKNLEEGRWNLYLTE